MNSLNKMDLIDLYYPTDETIAALLAGSTGAARGRTSPHPCRRVRGREGSAHLSSSGNDRCIRRQRSVMKIGYLSAFVLSQLYRFL